MEKVFTVGEKQYEEFKMSRFTKGQLDVMNKIPNNSLLLPAVPQRTKDGVKVMKLTNVDMIKLRSASYLREMKCKQMFKYDFTGLCKTCIFYCFRCQFGTSFGFSSSNRVEFC